MSRLSETKKLMRTQRDIDSQIFFFEFPVGQTKIRKKRIRIESHNGIIFNFNDKTVYYEGVKYEFRGSPFDLFYLLVKNNGSNMSEVELFEKVWGGKKKYVQGYVSSTICRINKRMGEIILLNYAKGYYLNIEHVTRRVA